jgi:ubiquinone/menaquinone biosynthesis C-methylase UbiE
MSTHEQWQLGGNAPEMYEHYLVPALFRPWAPMLIDAAALQPGDRVLDMACGTGVVARLVAQQLKAGGKVVGLDLNVGMLAVARSLSQAAELAVEWQEGNALALPFSDATFDVVLCQQGLQYFPDRPTALSEMHRVLVPGGRLALSIWRPIEHSPGYPVLVEALGQHIGAQAATTMRAAFSLGEASEVRTLLTEARFRDIDIRVCDGMVRFASPEDFVRGTAASSPFASLAAQAGDDARSALLSEVRTQLQPYVESSGLAFPIQTHLVTAHT